MGTDKYGNIGGVDSMMARFTPWHGLSDMKVRTDERVTDVDYAFDLGKINWTMEGTLLSTYLGDIANIINDHAIIVDDAAKQRLDALLSLDLADEHKLVIRQDTHAVLGVHSDRYGVIQNDVLKLLVRPVLEFRPDAHIESCGALFKGKTIWCLVRLDDETKTFGRNGDEKQYRYLLFYTSQDGSKPLAVRFTNVRVECMNTFSMAFGKASQLVQTIRHTTNATQYAAQAESALKQALQTFDLLDMEIETLLNTEHSKQDTFNVFKSVLGERPSEQGRSQTMFDKAFDGIVGEWNADHNQNIRGTAWGTVMAVNGYELWGQPARGQTVAEKQFKHLLDGRYKLTEKALAMVTA